MELLGRQLQYSKGETCPNTSEHISIHILRQISQNMSQHSVSTQVRGVLERERRDSDGSLDGGSGDEKKDMREKIALMSLHTSIHSPKHSPRPQRAHLSTYLRTCAYTCACIHMYIHMCIHMSIY